MHKIHSTYTLRVIKKSTVFISTVIVDLAIGCPGYATVHCRRPSVSCRRDTNMEQFASRRDVVKFRCKHSKPN